jgi:hypothetical protein
MSIFFCCSDFKRNGAPNKYAPTPKSFAQKEQKQHLQIIITAMNNIIAISFFGKQEQQYEMTLNVGES